ncbi:MAG TPA: glycosyltransferase family 4 protein, partial [bacterium]|nr:glycosyltransferase family 4 protein [bacterium]
MKTAIVHDWLTGMRGGEKVLEQLCSLYPAADIYTLIYDPLKITGRIKEHRVFTSFLQRIPGILKNYRNFLPLFPAAVESFNLKAYDLVISSSHCVAKGAKAASPERHVCYCHTPMRYAWDQFSGYFSKERTGRLKYGLISAVMPVLRKWDVNTASRAGHFAANSNHVRNRINKYYGRDAAVVYPPVDTEFYTPPVKKRKKGYCLMVT